MADPEPMKKAVDWTKVARKSKNKGKYGEKRNAELLMAWTGRAFRRTPNSGGYNKAGGVMIAGHRFCGDVICDDPNFVFCVECKNRPDDFQLATIVTCPSSAMFTDWWYQCLEDARQVNLLGMLCFKNSKASNTQVTNDFVAVTQRVLDHLQYKGHKLFLDAYTEPVWVNITEKEKGNPKKIHRKIKVKMPMPICVSWKLLAQYANPETLFTKPTWDISEEYKEMTILEKE